MVFSSIPAYLDPANWQQQPNHQIGATSSATIQLPVPAPPPPPPPPPPLQQPHGGSTGSIRPGSMADRARLANIPMPEAALKCPRCDSTNTKFCYFNNYSLTQPRHFCKTCRRYWTRGGALRNVPVGGGCRRNKRSKSGSSSKSPVSSADRQTGGSCNSSSTVSSNSGAGHDMLGLLGGPQVPPPLRFMAPLHHLTSEFTSGDIGLNYGTGLSSTPTGGVSDMSYQIGTALASVGLGSSLLPVGGLDQYRLQQAQQFSCFGGLDSASSSYPFDQGGAEPSGYGGGGGGGQIRSPKISISGAATQLASVKMEESNQGLNLSRQFLGIPAGNDQYWNGTPWTDLSSTFSSSSTSNPL